MADLERTLEQNPWILVVDDDDGFRECVKDIFKIEGFHVRSAGNGREALEIMNTPGEPGPALILLDLWMPEMSGIDFLDRLEITQPKLARETPVLLLSASPQKDMGRFGDIHPFLAKPADIENMLSMAKALIQ